MYGKFAIVYDRLIDPDIHQKLADDILWIFGRLSFVPGLVADLGCGSGRLTRILADQGFDMIGIDISAEMLDLARERLLEPHPGTLLLQQDMTEFELYGTVDAIVSSMDAVSYVTDIRQLRRMFGWVANYLNPGGVFVFDIQTEYKLSQVLGNHTFFDDREDMSLIWNNHYQKKSRICTFDLTAFIREGSLWARHDEQHRERAWRETEIMETASIYGLRYQEHFESFSRRPVRSRTERQTWVFRKAETDEFL